MIPRVLEKELLTQVGEFPVVTVLGPRQAGKTTLTRAALPQFEYVSLENPETLTIATEDPKAFPDSPASHPRRESIALRYCDRAALRSHGGSSLT